MKISESDLSYIWDIVDASKDIIAFIKKQNFNTFSNDKKTRYAVERQLLVIGEASKNLSQEFKNSINNIPWKKIIGLRNIIAHEYGEILVERIWNISNKNIQDLIDILIPYIPDKYLK